MKSLSRFDLVIIIIFVVVALAGGGAAYYLDAYQLAAAQGDVQSANDEFQTYSSKMPFLPTPDNVGILQGNIELIKAQLDPLIKNDLQPPDNKLADISTENSVDWKHRLDENVTKLNAAAKVRGVQVPANYYYSFSYFLSNAPAEEKTAVLSKQLLAIEQMANIMISAPVNSITSIRRTSEDAGAKDDEALPGHSTEVAGGLYTVYPFEIDFETTTDAFRKVVNGLMQSPYLFVIRNITVHNSQPASPQLGDLEKIAGTTQAPPSVLDSPGAVAAAKSTAGPQYLFGSEVLQVQMRVDLIEWKGLPPASAAGNK